MWGATESDAEQVKREVLEADYRLTRRCADGEVAAWEEIYAQCHDRLLSSIRAMLSGGNTDLDLVDEIAARVWYALVENDGRLLLKYDPKRGASLMTFMRVLAKDLLRRHYRSEQRRQDRERIALNNRPAAYSDELDHASSTLDEFLATLSAADRTFYEEYLVSSQGAGGSAELCYSQANVWQRTHRLYKRLLGFLGKES